MKSSMSSSTSIKSVWDWCQDAKSGYKVMVKGNEIKRTQKLIGRSIDRPATEGVN